MTELQDELTDLVKKINNYGVPPSLLNKFERVAIKRHYEMQKQDENLGLKEPKYEDMLKRNVIRIAKSHKEKCDGGECNISLILLLLLSKRAGLEFDDDELELFV